ncbi:MAG: hypothetical protein V3U24_01120 [Candidatus Neomarinimicrobiota bacterium]
MNDIDLLSKSGFQERKSEADKGKEKKSPKKSHRFSLNEFLAVLVAIALGLLVWWFFSLKSFVKSEVKEYTPDEFMMRPGS